MEHVSVMNDPRAFFAPGLTDPIYDELWLIYKLNMKIWNTPTHPPPPLFSNEPEDGVQLLEMTSQRDNNFQRSAQRAWIHPTLNALFSWLQYLAPSFQQAYHHPTWEILQNVSEQKFMCYILWFHNHAADFTIYRQSLIKTPLQELLRWCAH